MSSKMQEKFGLKKCKRQIILTCSMHGMIPSESKKQVNIATTFVFNHVPQCFLPVLSFEPVLNNIL